MKFQDHFSRQSEMYLKARPTYPKELFEYLASISPNQNLSWYCATGNGQAAISLAKYFKKIIATDGSEKQIANAIKADNIEYRIGTAEESGLENDSIDLITVATAAHWFNHDLFYKETQRVAAPNGILAIWTYSEAKISTEIDELMEWFMYTTYMTTGPMADGMCAINMKRYPFRLSRWLRQTFIAMPIGINNNG